VGPRTPLLGAGLLESAPVLTGGFRPSSRCTAPGHEAVKGSTSATQAFTCGTPAGALLDGGGRSAVAVAVVAQHPRRRNSPEGRRPAVTAKMLRGILPDIARHDVYLCGPPGLAEESYDALHEAGVPHRRIHHESFEF
jgi:hypothetical protein